MNRDLVAKLKKSILAGDPGHDKRVVTVPDGRKFSEVCAEGIQLEEGGLTSKEAYTRLGLSETAYRAGRDMVYLSLNPRLPDKVRQEVKDALREMDETRRIVSIHAGFLPLIERVWGRDSGVRNWKRQEKVVEDYLHAISCFAEAGEVMRTLNVPFLDPAEYKLARGYVERASAACRESNRRLRFGK